MTRTEKQAAALVGTTVRNVDRGYGRKVNGKVTAYFYGRNECWNLTVETKGGEHKYITMADWRRSVVANRQG